jgi:hypothetical protein
MTRQELLFHALLALSPFLLLPFLLSGCAGADRGILVVDPQYVCDGEVCVDSPCYVLTEEGVDYSACCPVGWSVAGLDVNGNVVCY